MLLGCRETVLFRKVRRSCKDEEEPRSATIVEVKQRWWYVILVLVIWVVEVGGLFKFSR